MSKKEISQAQHENFHLLMFIWQQLCEQKYTRGALEHGTNLWEMSDTDLEAAILEEMLDLSIYMGEKLRRQQ